MNHPALGFLTGCEVLIMPLSSVDVSIFLSQETLALTPQQGHVLTSEF